MLESKDKTQADETDADDGFGTPPPFVPPPKPEKPARESVKTDRTPEKPPTPVKMNTREKKAPELPKELESKKAMTKYVTQYGFSFKDYENLSYTDAERKAYQEYKRKHNREVPKEVFTAALRMAHSGNFPLVKAENASLDEMAID